MKILFFVLSILFLLNSCKYDDNVSIEYEKDKLDYQLSYEEVKSIVFEFLNSETKSVEDFNIISYKVNHILVSTLHADSTTMPNEVIPIYELGTESDGKTGYSFVIGDSRISKVLISAKEGSPNDTIYNEPLRTYFQSIPNILNRDLERYYNKPENSPTTKQMNVITYYAFLPTIWNQDGPYNSTVPYLCPSRSDGNARAGCVPVAIAQVLAYYRKPLNLDWNSILSRKIITYDSPAKVIDQVANLLVDIGKSVDIYYTCNGSGVADAEYASKVRNTLNSYGLSCLSYKKFNILEVASSLKFSYPVILDGWASGTIGHAWVCDGYKKHIYNNTYHEYLSMNWGWGGDSNGFYYVDTPPAFKTGSYIWGNLGMITNIKKVL